MLTPDTKEYWEGRTYLFKERNDFKRMLFDDSRFDEYEKRTQKILETIIKKGDKVLDVACGYGRFHNSVVSQSAKYTGIDFSEQMLKIAQEKYPEKDFVLANVKNWKPKEKFDVIFEVNSSLCLKQTPKEFFEQWKPYAKRIVACLECDEFIIFNLY